MRTMSGPFYFGVIHLKEIKPAKTIDQQISILEKRGVIIEDREKASNILLSVNYYNMSGYLHEFKNESGTYDNISFDMVYDIYQCDKKLKSILLYVIEDVEHNVKTKLAYSMALESGPLGYLNPEYFTSKSEHDYMLDLLQKNIDRNKKIPFVIHHISNYDGLFPIWVAIELFTLGMTWNCYKNLKTKTRKEVAKYFNTGVNQLESWIECVSYIRNLSAHNMRLYNFNMQKSPKHCNRNFKDFQPSYKIYDIIYIMKFLFSKKDEWNNYVLLTIESIFEQYSNVISLEGYGFRDDWMNTLRIK